MTRRELYALAQKRDLTGRSTMSKAQLRKALAKGKSGSSNSSNSSNSSKKKKPATSESSPGGDRGDNTSRVAHFRKLAEANAGGEFVLRIGETGEVAPEQHPRAIGHRARAAGEYLEAAGAGGNAGNQ
jgi:hypothetical protein